MRTVREPQITFESPPPCSENGVHAILKFSIPEANDTAFKCGQQKLLWGRQLVQLSALAYADRKYNYFVNELIFKKNESLKKNLCPNILAAVSGSFADDGLVPVHANISPVTDALTGPQGLGDTQGRCDGMSWEWGVGRQATPGRVSGK